MATSDTNPFKEFCPDIQLKIQRHYPPNFKVLSSHFPAEQLRMNATLEDTFHFTLCPPEVQQFLHPTPRRVLSFLPLSATQLESVYVWHPLLSLENVGVALTEHLEVLSGSGHNPLEYIFSCQVRASKLSEEIKSCCIPLLQDTVARVVRSGRGIGDDVIRLCRGDYAPEVRPTQFHTSEFLSTLINQLSDTELANQIAPLFNTYSAPSGSSLDVVPTRHYATFTLLFSVPRVAQLFIGIQLSVVLTYQPIDFELKTHFGTLFRISPLNTQPPHFRDATSLSPRDVETQHGMIGHNLTTLCDTIHQNLKPLFKHSPHQLFLWLALFLKRNQARGTLGAQLREDTFQLPLHTSDGMGLNVVCVLLKFCEKLWTNQLQAKINPFFCQVENRSGLESAVRQIGTNPLLVPIPHILELFRDTKLCTCEETEDLIIDLSPNFTFVTQVFHLAHFALRVYYVPVKDTFVRRSQRLGELRELLPSLEGDTHLKTLFENQLSAYLTLKSHLLCEQLTQLVAQFCLFSCSWFMFLTGTERVVTPQIACIPEFYLSNVLEILQFLSHTSGDTLATLATDFSHLIQFSTCFLSNSLLVANPHTRGKIAEVLGTLTHRDTNTRHFLMSHSERIRSTLESDQVALRHFLPALLKVFAEIEVTGDEVEFDQKFSYRDAMYDLIQYMWKSDHFRPCLDSLCEEVLSRTHGVPPVLMRFLNALINDATYLLDEGLDHVKKVATIEKLRNVAQWQELSDEEKSSKMEELTQETRFARILNRLASKTIDTLITISHFTPQILTVQSKLDSLASMLNYFLDQLTGSKNRNLAVPDRDKLGFQPIELLYDLLQVYFNLSEFPAFLSAVVSDGRCYSDQLLTNTQKVLGVTKAPYEKLAKWTQLCDTLSRVKRATLEEVAEDVPEEFLDELMRTVMSDPIRLPSGNVVDRATIERHILNQGTDPYTRETLSIEDLKPDPELKEKIEKWHKNK